MKKITENSGKRKRKYKFLEWVVCATTHKFNKQFVCEYHLPFAAVFSVPDHKKQFKIGNKDRVC